MSSLPGRQIWKSGVPLASGNPQAPAVTHTMKFLIADDHGVFRCGISTILNGLFDDVELVETASAQETLNKLEASGPVDLLLLDLTLPDSQGLGLLLELKRTWPAMPIAVISASEEASLIQGALRAGAQGYIPKSAPNAVIASAIQLILNGGIYVPHELLAHAEDGMPLPQDVNLTPRQLEVLALLAEGMSNKQIGTELNIAPGTIKAHIAAIFRELNVVNRTAAVHRARELRLI